VPRGAPQASPLVGLRASARFGSSPFHLW
jgi:hypothetical protein